MYSSSLRQNTLLNPLAAGSQRSVASAEVIKGIVLSAAYFAFARLGLQTRYDGPMFAVAAALIFPQWRPCLLLLVLSVQDAPGQVVPFDYLGVAGISALMILTAALQRFGAPLTMETKEFRGLLRLGLVLVIYGICSSAVQQHLGLHQQSQTRPYAIVGSLMAMMMVTGYLTHRELSSDPLSSIRVQTVTACILGHIFLIAGLQVVMGPMFGASPQGAEEMKQLFQMINGGARGMARLTGPFLSPNILASAPGLFMLIILRYKTNPHISPQFIVCFFVIGMTAAFLGGARTMLVFYLAGTAAMTWTLSPRYTILAGVLMVPLIILMDIPWGELLVIMRLKDLHSLGVRGEFWQATLQYMDAGDWLFGYGLTHFPVFVKTVLGYYGSDPHNWILSAAGMFGLLGLLFYAVLIRKLVRKSFSFDKKERAIAACLLLFFIGREFGNTQYLLNNNPLCCLYWISISLVFFSPADPNADEQAV
ncbi:MAG: O-antigen ligase family protein [Fuerstiella sp.]|jgi:hypothetical protein|nr:O-antigen ligase family protein [Fuerstiella sp.]MCP4510777.1 O-antigen ligase family protein [Fuerstiella sp.]